MSTWRNKLARWVSTGYDNDSYSELKTNAWFFKINKEYDITAHLAQIVTSRPSLVNVISDGCSMFTLNFEWTVWTKKQNNVLENGLHYINTILFYKHWLNWRTEIPFKKFLPLSLVVVIHYIETVGKKNYHISWSQIFS